MGRFRKLVQKVTSQKSKTTTPKRPGFSKPEKSLESDELYLDSVDIDTAVLPPLPKVVQSVDSPTPGRTFTPGEKHVERRIPVIPDVLPNAPSHTSEGRVTTPGEVPGWHYDPIIGEQIE